MDADRPSREHELLDEIANLRAQLAEERQQAKLLRLIVEGTPDAIFAKDTEGRYLLFNAGAARLTGREPAEVLGRDDTVLFPAAEARELMAWDRTLMSGGETTTREVTLTDAHGTRHTLLATKGPIEDDAGEVIGLFGISRDISERKAMDEALQRSEAIYRTLVENIDLGITLMDADHRVIMTNPAVARLFDAEADGFAGQHCFRAFEGRDAVCPHCAGTRAMRSHRPESVETEGLRPDGGTVPVRIRAFPIVASQGEVRGFIEVLEDITEERTAEAERQRMEQQMREVQKLESLGVLAGGIAHDFNNLLAGILGNADLALLKSSPDSPSRPYLEGIGEAAQRAAELTRQLLAYSGKGRFVVEPVDLNALVGGMEPLLKTVAAKTARVHYDLRGDLPPIDADATQVRQVVMNLILNASEALGGREGSVAIATGATPGDRIAPGTTIYGEPALAAEYVYVEVSDTGSGIDADVQARMFEPFFTTKETGRGLGLAAVLGIVRGHQGVLQVSSAPDRGTSFTVYFPAGEAQDEGPVRPEKEPPGPEAKGVVLVVDDEAAVRTVTKEMLSHQGFTVLTAADGVEGVDVFRAHADEITAVVLDMTMPRMGGEEAFRKIRDIRGDVPVILSSGYNEQDTVGRFAGAGIAAFVQKPYRAQVLLDILADLGAS